VSSSAKAKDGAAEFKISGPLALEAQVTIIEGRRAVQDRLMWQTVSFFLLTEGVLISALVGHSLHREPKIAVAIIGIASSTIFWLVYSRARYMSFLLSVWLHEAAEIDPGTTAYRAHRAAPNYRTSFLSVRPNRLVLAISPSLPWLLLFFGAAGAWIAFLVPNL
jgi:hypothetical protein